MRGSEGNARGGAGLLMVLVDALRWDYPERTPYLRELSARSTTGRLVEPFGFTPRAAYFSGVDVEAGGFTHMFEWNPESSPFSGSRFMPALAESTPAAASLRDALRVRGRSLASDFASRYLDPAHIPLEYLRFFDVAERTSPWGPDAAPGSLFDLLRSHDKRAYTCAWPDCSGMSDAAIVARTLHELKGDARFAFVHLSKLDAVGHVHGPGSLELQRALEQADTHLRALLEHARSIWRHPRVLLFGDHGMVPVVRTIDVRPVIESAGLSFGRDFGYFIDSTTVRFWYFTSDARSRIRSAVGTIEGGHFVTDDERHTFGLDRAGWRNGEDFFLASPGVLFSPSFFGAAPLKGMHGYDPGCVDNQGAFIYWTPSDETPRDAGAVRATRLFSTALAACDIPLPCGAPLPVRAASSQRRKPSWTFTMRPQEALVERDMRKIVHRILTAVPDCEAVVLTGSFGRGEGVVRDEPELSAVNDYDVMVIGGRPREDIGAVRQELEARCAVDAIDLAWADPSRAVGPSQFGFDLRHGSRVLYGHASALERHGPPAPGQLTMADAWLGLSNRACGLLEVIHSDASDRAVRLQLTKFAVALGDAYLILFGDYHTRHAVRAARFHDLADAAGVPRDIVRAVSAGYQRKLGLDATHCDAGIEVEDALNAVADIARRTAEVSGIVEYAASQAVDGRRRQTPSAPGEEPQLPPAFAADLEDIYRTGWRLLQNPALDAEWRAERGRVIDRWRKAIH